MRQMIFLTMILLSLQSLGEMSVRKASPTSSIRQKILQRRLLMSLQPMRISVAEWQMNLNSKKSLGQIVVQDHLSELG